VPRSPQSTEQARKNKTNKQKKTGDMKPGDMEPGKMLRNAVQQHSNLFSE